MLTGPEVLEAMKTAAQAEAPSPAERMLRVLTAARDAGGDSRGLKSAALLVLEPERPPLDLRIDQHDSDPVSALGQLWRKTCQSPYFDWLAEVPVLNDKSRAPQ